MGSAAGPKTVLNGITSLLDAGSSKSWNVGISTNWTDRIGSNDATIINTVYNTDGPFAGAGYVEFDGTGDYLSIANSTDFDLGLSSEAFTMEAWVNASSLGTNVIIGRGGGSGSWNATNGHQYLLFYSGGTDLYFQWWNGSSYSSINSTGALTTNDWTHLAVVFDGTDVKMYKNGTLLATGSSAAFAKPSASNITRIASAASGSVWDGDISNVRIVKGTALYTSAFTPPTKLLTAITNTVLLTCQGNTIADASSSGHTLTPNGDVTLTKEPFTGAGAVEFDGNGDYLDIASSTDFAFGTGDFTIEVWVYLKSNNLGVIYSNEVANSLFLHLSSGNFIVRNYGTSNLFDLAAPSLNTWTHIALSRSGTDARLFFNGVQQGSTVTNSTNWTQNGTEIGAYSNGSQSLNGYMSNLRVIKGTALYTSNFTAPTRKLDPIENTVLLTCQGQNIKDNSSSAHAITFNGNAKSSIVDGAFEFDGTANTRMTIPNTSDFDFAGGNFTLEWWGRYNVDTASGDTIITKGWDTVYAPFLIQLTSATQLTFYASGSGSAWNVSSGNAIHTGIEREVWYHYVLTRSGSSFKGYVNGVETMSFTSSTALMSNGDEITIGSGDDGHSTSELNGYISNLKVYKGKALTVAEITQNYTALKGRYGY